MAYSLWTEGDARSRFPAKRMCLPILADKFGPDAPIRKTTRIGFKRKFELISGLGFALFAAYGLVDPVMDVGYH